MQRTHAPSGRDPISPRRFLLGLGRALGLALLPLLCACPSMPPREPPPPTETEVVAGPPAWTKEPMSWQKLEMIEQWLDNSSGRHSPELVVEARLQLAEGRLLFSRRDIETSSAPREALRVRIESAKAGFEQILADPAASAGARNRAQVGLRGAEVLLAAPGTKTVAVIKRAQWNARAPRTSNLTPLKGQWSRITVHHSAESTTDPRGGSLEESSGTVRSIQKFHMDDPEHRWGDIGYHFLIDSGGRIFEGRELEWQGAHAGGSNNYQNIGICLLGDLEKRAPSEAALKSLQVLLDDLRTRFRIPADRVAPHSEYATTRCPGPALTAWLRKYK